MGATVLLRPVAPAAEHLRHSVPVPVPGGPRPLQGFLDLVARD